MSTLGFTLEKVDGISNSDRTSPQQGQNQGAQNQGQSQQAQEQTVDLAQAGNVNVYGSPIQSDQQASNSPQVDTNNYQDNSGGNQSNDPWSDLFGNLMAMALSARVMYATMHSPFPLPGHPYEARIRHFDDYVDNSPLGKVAQVTHDVSHIAHDVGNIAYDVSHVIRTIKGGRG